MALLATMSMMAASAKKPSDTNTMLWYDAPAKIWLEALPIGNSKLGAMVYGGTDVEEIQLNEETFWSGGPHHNNSPRALGRLEEVRELIFDGKEEEAAKILDKDFVVGPHGMKYLTLGSLKMNFGHKDVTNYRRELNLENAMSNVSYTCDGVTYVRMDMKKMVDIFAIPARAR